MIDNVQNKYNSITNLVIWSESEKKEMNSFTTKVIKFYTTKFS
jgi:hypothetical protein